MSKAIDLTEKRFGRLIVKDRAERNDGRGIRWLCSCDCGEVKVVRGRDLRSEHTKSCGCLRKELSAERIRRLGPIWSQSAARLRATTEIPRWHKNARGYMVGKMKYHPLANSGGTVQRSWFNKYEAEGKLDWVVQALKEGFTLHHRNGKRDDDRPENLQLRFPSKHPQGISEGDIVDWLTKMGYEVRNPKDFRG